MATQIVSQKLVTNYLPLQALSDNLIHLPVIENYGVTLLYSEQLYAQNAIKKIKICRLPYPPHEFRVALLNLIVPHLKNRLCFVASLASLHPWLPFEL